MSQPSAMRAFRSACVSCRSSLTATPTAPFRPFSSGTRVLAAAPTNRKGNIGDMMDNVMASQFQRAPSMADMIPGHEEYNELNEGEWARDERYHLHVYSHKHNTHITLTRPNRNPLISLSCGNIGFKKAGRGTYDSAYQLAAFVMARIQDKGFLMDTKQTPGGIKEIELIYRGFGPGREAVTKAILGSEGRNIRPLINKLSDSTRLKFGGTRSKKPRRLG